MLTIFDIPPKLNTLYSECKSGAEEFFSITKGYPETILPHGSDILEDFSSGIVFIHGGYLKYFYDEKLVRFYSAGDILTITESLAGTCSLRSEMASKITIIPSSVFLPYLSQQPHLLEKWLNYLEKERQLMAGLCSVYLKEECNPKIDIRIFQLGDLIIEEDAKADSLYEMISGEAEVTIHGTEVGRIQKGEVFGEISFLTQSPRTASVRALSTCTVQTINGNDFDLIASCRPAMLKSMAKTIAKRLTDVNDRLVRISLT
jgi:CRP/FNR family transcriptional regulator, cyclic AMP receptor protein